MSRKVKYSIEEKNILTTLTVEQLQFFRDFYEGKNFKLLFNLFNSLVILEKNRFFDKQTYDSNKLFRDHAYSQGSVDTLEKLLHLIAGSGEELLRREDKKEK